MRINTEQVAPLLDFPYFSFIVATLVIVATILLSVPKLSNFAKPIGLITSVVVLAEVITVCILFDFTAPAKFQFSEIYSWIPILGVTWSFGVNAFSLIMILGSALLVTLVLIAGWNDNEYALIYSDNDENEQKHSKESRRAINQYLNSISAERIYIALVLFLEAFIITIFATRDLFVFYLAFEAMLIPAYFMITRFGIGKDKTKAGMKFLLYSLLGGLVMLLGVITIYIYTPYTPYLFNMDTLSQSLHLPFRVEVLAFISFFIAFAIKAPMYPVHTWLTTTVENARPTTSALLVGILDKIGTFGMLSFTLVLFPKASKFLAIYIVIWAVISIFYGGLLAIWEKNILRLISLTSVSHFGFIILGIYIGSSLAMTGALTYMIAHMASIAGLFLTAGYLGKRTNTFDVNSMGGMQRKTPVIAGCFLVSGLATVALPGLSGFVPEYLVLMGVFSVIPTVAIICVLAVIISAVYILLPYQKIFAGTSKKYEEYPDMNFREKFVAGVLIVLMLVIGIFPNLLLNSFSKVSDFYNKETQIVKNADGDYKQFLEYEKAIQSTDSIESMAVFGGEK